MYTLFARAGWGSVIVEAQLALYGLSYRLEEVGDLFASSEARDALSAVNPLAQLPTLLLPDGTILTESAAITLLLAEQVGDDALVPREGARERPAFLRWLVFLVANVYPTFTYADDPARFVPDGAPAESFRTSIDEYRKRLWRMTEAAATADPWFLGPRFSALDIYLCAMTRWTPKRPWFAAETPKLAGIAGRTESEPRLAAVWARNFPAS